MPVDALRIAIIHDELVRRGGAERVLDELLRIFPQAHVYALYASNTPFIQVDGRTYPIRTTFLQSFPLWFRKHPKRLAPLLLHAAERIDLSDYDLVISSSSAFAKGVITRSHVPHISYCHTPTRYVWEREPKGIVESVAQHILKMTDYAAAQRPDMYIANSEYTQNRIQKYYRKGSTVVYPPVAADFFTPNPNIKKGAYFLCVGRLTPAKYFEHAIHVCEKLRLPLRIVGSGLHRKKLEKIAGPYTTFFGKLSQKELRMQYQGARALLQPGVEDFGIASVEALACGTPVIAAGKGGVTEIISSQKYGVLYREPVQELLADAIRRFIDVEHSYTPAALQAHALRFSSSRFRTQLLHAIEQATAKRQTIGKNINI